MRNKSRCFRQFPFIAAGLTALIWFVLRVVPKPSRAAYPCQRAAAPAAAVFWVWLCATLSARLGVRFLKRRSARWTAVLMTGLLVLSGLLVFFQPALPVRAQKTEQFIPSDPPNQPIGTPRGIFPGRVVWMHDPESASWDGNGFWWEDAYTHRPRVEAMLSRAVLSLSGETDEAAAWDALFRHFNQRRAHDDSGYRPGQKIAIKLNLMQSSNHGTGGNACFTTPQLLLSLIRSLVAEAGIPDTCIVCYDATAFIPSSLYAYCKAEFPGVRFYDWEGGDGRLKAVRDQTRRLYWSRPLVLEPKGGNPAYLTRCLTESDYLINIANLKAHGLAGVTLCAKNHFGSICADYHGSAHQSAPQAAGLHPYIAAYDVDYGSDDWRFAGRAMGTYTPLVDLMGHPDAGEKTLLFLVDGFYAVQSQLYAVDQNMKWQSDPFNGDWTSSLLASLDGVAIESVGLDLLRNESTLTEVHGTVDNYLHEAALADDPPSGVFYDPDGDGARLPGLGVHEHWNNAADRLYSVNLGTGHGIELLVNPTVLKRSEVQIFTSYGLVTGSGSYTAGEQITISVEPAVVPLADGMRAVFQAWSGEGENAYSGPEPAFTLTVNGDISETAVWRKEAELRVSVDPPDAGLVTADPQNAWIPVETRVTLIAEPAPQFQWAGWSGDTSEADSVITVLIDTLTVVTAHFTPRTDVSDNRMPRRFDLKPNRPNPFNPDTVIPYDLPESGRVVLTVFDIRGRHLRTLVNTVQSAGAYEVPWDGCDDMGVSVTGPCLVRLKCGLFQETMKILLLK